MLGVVFESPFANDVVFKGGTSLSKVFGVIDRFSEDIDLSLSPEFLKLPVAGASRNQAHKWMESAEAACSDAVRGRGWRMCFRRSYLIRAVKWWVRRSSGRSGRKPQFCTRNIIVRREGRLPIAFHGTMQIPPLWPVILPERRRWIRQKPEIAWFGGNHSSSGVSGLGTIWRCRERFDCYLRRIGLRRCNAIISQ